MTIYRCILPSWRHEQEPSLRKVLEGEFTEDQIQEYNEKFYNIYYLPNHPALYEGGAVSGFQIDTFNYVFVDFDLKSGTYPNKESFIKALKQFKLPATRIVDSGNGIHAFWAVSDLDANSYLKLQRRLLRTLKTDEAVGQIYQLMRVPNTVNTKVFGDFKMCEVLEETTNTYTCEQLDAVLPPITFQDEQYCKQHHDKTYRVEGKEAKIDEKIPLKFTKLLNENKEVKELWVGDVEDRSKADFRIGHIMFASGFTKAEATSVLVNTAKAMGRAPIHRLSYATNIVDRIWTFEAETDKTTLSLSKSVEDILSTSTDDESLRGQRFPCWKYIDDTENGFRLGHVLGFVAGSGVGKTSVTLNMFKGFVQNNPNYEHFFVSLEQPAKEIALRWKKLCGENTSLHKKVHIIDNYNEDDTFRNLSLQAIQDYINKFQQVTGKKVGCVVIDHIGILSGKKGTETEVLMDVCKHMKTFARNTQTFLVMQSQAPREKAGEGDQELNKDAAFGTSKFENFCDYLVTMWQPLKLCYPEGAPTITSYKFCKIRHKNQDVDKIKEDVRYNLRFDPRTELLHELTQVEETSFDFFIQQASNKRKEERKDKVSVYTSMKTNEDPNGKVNSDKNPRSTNSTGGFH